MSHEKEQGFPSEDMERLKQDVAKTFDRLEALLAAPPASSFYIIPNPEKLSPEDPVRPLVEKMSERISPKAPELWLPSTYTDETNGESS